MHFSRRDRNESACWGGGGEAGGMGSKIAGCVIQEAYS